jgi:FkbM family methyltransferase
VFETVAIAESAADREISRVSLEAVNARLVPGWAKGISSLYEDRNAIGGMNGLLYGRKMPERNYAALRQHIKKETINCMTLKQLLKKNNVSKIDVLQIDTEGYDYKIFRQFDFNAFLPYFVKVEVGNLPQHEYQEILNVLESHQYSCQLDNLDLYGQLPLPPAK